MLRRGRAGSARSGLGGPRPRCRKAQESRAELRSLLADAAETRRHKDEAVEPAAIYVIFPESERRFAAKLRRRAASALVRGLASSRTPGCKGSPPSTTGRYALASSPLGHERGSRSSSNDSRRASPTRRGQARASVEVARRQRRADRGLRRKRLVSESEVGELSRRALRVAAGVTKHAGRDRAGGASKTPSSRAIPCRSSSSRCSGCCRDCRRRLAWRSSLTRLGRSASWWAMAHGHPVPVPRRAVAARLVPPAVGLLRRRAARVQPLPSWPTYSSLCELSAKLLEKLQRSARVTSSIVDGLLPAIAWKRPPVAERRAVSPVPARAGSTDAASATPRKKR